MWTTKCETLINVDENYESHIKRRLFALYENPENMRRKLDIIDVINYGINPRNSSLQINDQN